MSNGWLDRFKKRFNIKSKVITGEAGGVREETVTSWQECLLKILSSYFLGNILNIEELGQCLQVLPNRSLAEVSKLCTLGKKSKERVTCTFFVDAVGGRENLIVISK